MELKVLKNLVLDAKRRANKKGSEFDINVLDLDLIDECPILHIPLYSGVKNQIANSPTIDRKDNSKGYIKGNVWIISNLANQMKSSANKEQLQMFAKWVLQTYPLDVS